MSHREVLVCGTTTKYLVIIVGAIALLAILIGTVETFIVVMPTIAIIVTPSVGLTGVQDILTKGRRTVNGSGTWVPTILLALHHLPYLLHLHIHRRGPHLRDGAGDIRLSEQSDHLLGPESRRMIRLRFRNDAEQEKHVAWQEWRR